MAAWLDPGARDDQRDRILRLVNAALLTRQFVHDADEIKVIEGLLTAS